MGSEDKRINLEDFKDYYNIVSCMFPSDNIFEDSLNEVWKFE